MRVSYQTYQEWFQAFMLHACVPKNHSRPQNIDMAELESFLATLGTNDITPQHLENLLELNAQILPEFFAAPQDPSRDFERELERVLRDGKEFSVALLRIKPKDTDITIAHIMETLQRSLRGFDETYAVSEQDVVVFLKHADSSGGIGALKRLQNLIDNVSQDKYALQCCIVQPNIGDSYDMVLQNLSVRLNHEKSEDSKIIEYRDTSELEMLIQKQGLIA